MVILLLIAIYAMHYGIKVENMKKNFDIKTYKEILIYETVIEIKTLLQFFIVISEVEK